MRTSLNHIAGMKRGIDDLSAMDYAKISIQERSLTIKGKHYVYETGFVVPVAFQDKEWEAMSTQSIEGTTLQLHIAQKTENGMLKFGLLLIEQPGSRRQTLLGSKNLRDVLLCTFLTDENVLLKLRTDRQQDHYWTVIDASGYV